MTSCARSVAANRAKVMAGPTAGRYLRLGHLHMTEDRAHNIVEIVRDAACESADRLHPARSLQIRLQPSALPLEQFPLHGAGNSVDSHAQQPEFIGSYAKA